MSVITPPAITQDEVDRFWADGFLVVRGALSRQEADHFAELIRALLPGDLRIPDHWQAFDGRFKPFQAPGVQTFDGPDFIPLFQNERLYAVMTRLLRSHRLLVRDGSLAITMRNDTAHASELSQQVHLDPAVPEDVDDFLFTPEEIEIGGCFYFTDVAPHGGGIHVVPGGHRLVEEAARGVPGGRQLHDKWRNITDLETVEVTGSAGDFVLMHHLMPHAASHNRNSTTRVAQFLRYSRDDAPWGMGERPGDRPGANGFDEAQLAAMTPLGRKLLGVDPW
ncbi:phytanoyl-CoA dioxygenase family protein [Micromonospora sp. NPDC092111]|uniref:phytanoyl-CoA dioxygenase family protein n=1 Tax=Micromonospora sp. NPDC092111 TaxID=3364289 RepID=UPI0037FAD921